MSKSSLQISEILTNTIAQDLQLSRHQVQSALELLVVQEGTIPFVARYRKDQTRGLDEVQLAQIINLYEAFCTLEKRREFILSTLTLSGRLTDELRQALNAAHNISELEDLYAPYKSKRKSKGELARELGLLPLANLILTHQGTWNIIHQRIEEQFISEQVPTAEIALEQAAFILWEMIAHHVPLKNALREHYWEAGELLSQVREKLESSELKEAEKYRDYFDYREDLRSLQRAMASHRFLAMRRGWQNKILKLEVVFPPERAVKIVEHFFPCPSADSQTNAFFQHCWGKAWRLFLHPSLDLEIKTQLKNCADETAIATFCNNLKDLLLAPYLGNKRVLAIDPGVRSGLKVVVISETGELLLDTVVYPFSPQNDRAGSLQKLEQIITKFAIEYLVIGNGTYGRESLTLVEELPLVASGKIKALLISEAGASVYSTSDLARSEFPDKDPTVRGAISIGRRFQDPLADLVKIDAKSIGVGQYQHDVNPGKLKKSLEQVVENCVNHVGVDLNTASAPLLAYVSGIGPGLAQQIVNFRQIHGAFTSRQQLNQVPRFTGKNFLLAAGFLRIYHGTNPLDATFIHPENYPLLEQWVLKQNTTLEKIQDLAQELAQDQHLQQQVGELALTDIVRSLCAPRQDPRTEFKPIAFRQDIKSLKDLKLLQWYPGVVTNITNFGLFVDIGIKENGLLHLSELPERQITGENLFQFYKVGQELKVKVIRIDQERGRVSLSAKVTGPAPLPQKSNKLPETPKKNAFAALKNWKS